MAIVICDLETTLINELKCILNSSSNDCRTLLRQFLNAKKKSISTDKREVFISNELHEHNLFKYEKRDVIQNIIYRIARGQDVNIYLSNRQGELNHTDLTLTVFGLHHLHLGDKVENKGKRKGLIKGTKSILFAKFDKDRAYLVDILSHDIETGFLNRKLLNIIHKNWPHLLEPYRIKRMGVSCRDITDTEFTKMIKHGINIPFSPEDGVVFFLPGSLTMANTDADNEMVIIGAMKDIERAERRIKDILHHLSAYIKKTTGIEYNVLRFSVVLTNDGLAIENKNSGIFLLFAMEIYTLQILQQRQSNILKLYDFSAFLFIYFNLIREHFRLASIDWCEFNNHNNSQV
ncbi:hypothetical protein [Thiobaca trueperi]|uniref:Uncharacterized protein n=1 Tax=Thiobaca trueperi TaxID=127458 RepID=A0A4R3MWX9_9GAMM|nr:hypothetical protein [Thiobaca trueperi]TCT20257.1 hypothetical protein EDC35_106184 [Thiobaca trueperi]